MPPGIDPLGTSREVDAISKLGLAPSAGTVIELLDQDTAVGSITPCEASRAASIVIRHGAARSHAPQPAATSARWPRLRGAASTAERRSRSTGNAAAAPSVPGFQQKPMRRRTLRPASSAVTGHRSPRASSKTIGSPMAPGRRGCATKASGSAAIRRSSSRAAASPRRLSGEPAALEGVDVTGRGPRAAGQTSVISCLFEHPLN